MSKSINNQIKIIKVDNTNGVLMVKLRKSNPAQATTVICTNSDIDCKNTCLNKMCER